METLDIDKGCIHSCQDATIFLGNIGKKLGTRQSERNKTDKERKKFINHTGLIINFIINFIIIIPLHIPQVLFL